MEAFQRGDASVVHLRRCMAHLKPHIASDWTFRQWYDYIRYVITREENDTAERRQLIQPIQHGKQRKYQRVNRRTTHHGKQRKYQYVKRR